MQLLVPCSERTQGPACMSVAGKAGSGRNAGTENRGSGKGACPPLAMLRSGRKLFDVRAYGALHREA